jgi:diamine N-acetyltransferase
VISLRPLAESDQDAVAALRVAPSHERFVSSVAESLREAAEHPGARALYWVVHADDTPVGFVMIADEVASPDYLPHYLRKLLIDERYGFERTGEVHSDEVLLELKLREHGKSVR